MQKTLQSPPRTSMDVFEMLPEGTLAEVIDNRLYMSPSPKGKHQRTLRNLFRSVDQFVVQQGLGEVLFAPLDVYLDEQQNAVQPDLIFISSEKASIIDDDDVVHGVPDLIIEVLSKGNQDHDEKTKKDLYERFGVKEYWIVDPSTKLSTGYQLQRGAYKSLESSHGKIMSALFQYSFTF
jgi:Uma2 family endonuclease